MRLRPHAVAVDLAKHPLDVIRLLPPTLGRFLHLVALDDREVRDQVRYTKQTLFNESGVDERHTQPLSKETLTIWGAGTVHVIHEAPFSRAHSISDPSSCIIGLL